MKENIILAWRNIWRNKRRTLITSASIFFAIFFALVLRSFQIGTNNALVYGIIESYSGFIQIHGNNFEDEMIIDNCIPYNSEIEQKILSTENVNLVIPRIHTFGLVSSGEKTKNAIIIGIDIDKEVQINSIEKQIVKIRITPEKLSFAQKNNDFPSDILEKLKIIENHSFTSCKNILKEVEFTENEQEKYFPKIETYFKFSGEYFSQNDNGIIIADKLSKFLEIDVGDSLIIISQGYHGVSAGGIFPVKAIIKVLIPEFDNSLIYTTLNNAQNLFSTYDVNEEKQDTSYLVSYLTLGVENKTDNALISTTDKINSKLDVDIYEAVYWKDFNNELLQLSQGDNVAGIFLLSLLYFITGFGVFGTVLMMTNERKREFGVMIAVGMQKSRLKFIVVIEMIIIGLIGIISGIIASIPIIVTGYHFPVKLGRDFAIMMEDYNLEPQLPMAWFDYYYLNQTIVVLAIVIIASILPIYRIGKIKITNAIKT